MTGEHESPKMPMPLVRCRHILCKGMLVHGDAYTTPVDETCRSTDFWCQQTQRVLGPDGVLVSLSRCTDARPCYEDL